MQTVNCTVTVEDVWAGLVRNADMKVLKPKQRKDQSQAHIWVLRFSSRDNTTRVEPCRR